MLTFVAITVTGRLAGGYYKSEKSRRISRARTKAARVSLRIGDFDEPNAAVEMVMRRRAELEVHRGVALDISVTFVVLGVEMLLTAGYLIGPAMVVVIIVQLILAAVWLYRLAIGGPRMRRNSRKFLAERDVPHVLGPVPQAPPGLPD